MANKTLAQIVAEKPYLDYAEWWPMGKTFLAFMSVAIGTAWRAVGHDELALPAVQQDVTDYIECVYRRSARSTLAADFLYGQTLATMRSGEFDALSYAFFKSAFLDIVPQAATAAEAALARRAFTQQVGKQFYHQLHEHLGLSLPATLTRPADFVQLQQALTTVGDFLQAQGYLRDHFAFRFDVTATRPTREIQQKATDFIADLQQYGVAYALYEMGYPAILPSAVYLFHTLGEAQHHSSRTIEELFGRMGYLASETADFDPTGYPSDGVVELWEIRPG